jgi:Family of unknown function (DUF6350)
MTTTLDRPPARTAVAPDRPLVAGGAAALWAAGAGLIACAVPVLLVWVADARSAAGAGAALRAAGQLWLACQGAPLALPGGHLGLLPMGLVALPLALLARAGGSAARSSAGDVSASLRLVAAVAGVYALVAAVVAGLSGSGALRPSPVAALVHASLVGAVGAGLGVLRQAGTGRAVAGLLPARLRRTAPPAAAALAVLLGGGALLAGGSLVVHGGLATELARAGQPGVVGGVALLLLGLTLVPNAAVWGASWLAGPGFAVGVGTAVGPFGVTLGPVPALPLLAALPADRVPAWVGALALLVPLAAGGLAGLLAHRRGLGRVDVLLTGPLAGLAAGVLAAWSGGPVGDGRLSAVGPSPWRLAVALTVEVAVGALVAAELLRRRAAR